MLRVSTLALVGVLTAAVASPAASTPPAKIVDGAWVDGAGREVFVPASAFASDPLIPGKRPFADLLALFDEACLQVPIDSDHARPAMAKRSDWGFAYLDADAGTKLGARLDGWQASDVSLTSEPTAWPLPECNLLAARASADLVDAVAGALGERLAAPSVQRKIKGGGTALRWDVTGPTGEPRRVYAFVTTRDGVAFLYLGLTEQSRQTRR